METSGFIAWVLAAATKALFFPTSACWKRNCLERLDSAIESASTTVMFPTPSKAKSFSSSHPRAPAPQIRTLLRNIRKFIHKISRNCSFLRVSMKSAPKKVVIWRYLESSELRTPVGIELLAKKS